MTILGIILVFLALIIAVVVLMYPVIPKYVGWSIVTMIPGTMRLYPIIMVSPRL